MLHDAMILLTLTQWLWIIIAIATVASMAGALVILPQQWRQEDYKTTQHHLKPGMRIKTLHGLSGTICHISENFIIIEQDDGRKIEILAQTVAPHHEAE